VAAIGPHDDPLRKEIVRVAEEQAERALRESGEQAKWRGSCPLVIAVTWEKGPVCGDQRVIAANVEVRVPGASGDLFYRTTLDVGWQDEVIEIIQQRVAMFVHEYSLARWVALGMPEK